MNRKCKWIRPEQSWPQPRLHGILILFPKQIQRGSFIALAGADTRPTMVDWRDTIDDIVAALDFRWARVSQNDIQNDNDDDSRLSEAHWKLGRRLSGLPAGNDRSCLRPRRRRPSSMARRCGSALFNRELQEIMSIGCMAHFTCCSCCLRTVHCFPSGGTGLERARARGRAAARESHCELASLFTRPSLGRNPAGLQDCDQVSPMNTSGGLGLPGCWASSARKQAGRWAGERPSGQLERPLLRAGSGKNQQRAL